MQLCFIVLVYAIALAVTIDAAMTAANLAGPSTLTETSKSIRSKTRLNAGKGGDEARAFTDLSTIKSWLTKSKATHDELKQLKAWQKEKQTPQSLLTVLKMDDDIETLLAIPNFNTWSAYLTMYDKKFPEQMENMLNVFIKTYGDEAVAKMLETAKSDPGAAHFVHRLQDDLLAAWSASGLSTDVVFNLLKVNEEGVKDLFTTLAFNVWSRYFSLFNHHSPDRDANMMKQLLTSFDEFSLAKMLELANKDEELEFLASGLQKALFEKWLQEGKTPETILKRLKLSRLKWASDPTMEIFRTYAKLYAYKFNFRPKKFGNSPAE